MSDRESEQLAAIAFKITLYLIFGVFILLIVGLRDHPKATLAVLGIAAIVGAFLFMLNG